jgi:serine kinase of HPr protein (carbohydrate metabolism regulator)
MTVSARDGMPADAVNVHTTVIVLGDRGVAITGPSGAGKTTLALELVRRGRAAGGFARLVGDDQVFIMARAGRVLALAPRATAGLAEVRGLGPQATAYEPAAVIDCVIELVGPDRAPRLAPDASIELAGVTLPLFRLPRADTTTGALAAEAIVASLLRPNDQVPTNRSARVDLGLPSCFSQTT